jgi:aminobenzoyl-glutamate utilization protein B
MALATLRTMERPEIIAKAKEELLRKNGGSYTCPLPEYVQPPIGKY